MCCDHSSWSWPLQGFPTSAFSDVRASNGHSTYDLPPARLDEFFFDAALWDLVRKPQDLLMIRGLTVQEKTPTRALTGPAVRLVRRHHHDHDGLEDKEVIRAGPCAFPDPSLNPDIFIIAPR